MSYRGKTLLLKDNSYGSSIYLNDFSEGTTPPLPPSTNVYSTEENSGIKKVYVTDENKAFAIV